MTIISINQPAYLAWGGYFDRIKKSDVHVVLDHVPMSKDSMTNRNKIRGKDEPVLLTVPVKHRGGPQPIRDIETADDDRWQNKHYAKIWEAYSKAPFFSRHMEFFGNVYNSDWPMLQPLISVTNDYFLEQFDIKTPLVYSTEMQARGAKSDLNLNICKEIGATVYLSGPFGREYLDFQSFADAGIEIRFHEAAPTLSAIDHLFHNEGFDI